MNIRKGDRVSKIVQGTKRLGTVVGFRRWKRMTFVEVLWDEVIQYSTNPYEIPVALHVPKRLTLERGN